MDRIEHRAPLGPGRPRALGAEVFPDGGSNAMVRRHLAGPPVPWSRVTTSPSSDRPDFCWLPMGAFTIT